MIYSWLLVQDGAEAFLRSLEKATLEAREAAIETQFRDGKAKVRFVPIEFRESINGQDHLVKLKVATDYLHLGDDQKPFYVPLTPYTAQRIATHFDASLPTPKLVDKIYAQAGLKLTPAPIPPTPAMTTIPVFLDHTLIVQRQLEGKTVDQLIAGHKKDVVICKALATTFGKVAISGWHKPDGLPIQPLYLGHTARWADYSHGIRLVSNEVEIDGKPMKLAQVLKDKVLAPLVSGEGPLEKTAYEFAEFPVDGLAQIKTLPGEELREVTLQAGVRAVIHSPKTLSDAAQVVIYALPNGNTIEQTFGRKLKPGMDWHFDIQHIGAQTRWLWRQPEFKNLVVVYLENSQKSWPAWSRAHSPAEATQVFDKVAKLLPGPVKSFTLNSHSGGGALLLSMIKGWTTIPKAVNRIAFLDSNYNYDTMTHFQKLVDWLSQPSSSLYVLAYDDANGLLNGKPFVSAAGGTWGRTKQLVADFETVDQFDREGSDLERLLARKLQMCVYRKANPNHEIFHTVQVERNGFIDSILFGSPLWGKGYRYFGDRAYSDLIRD
jgi:hypothetical protein